MSEAVIYTIIAGVVGTTVGGVLGLIFSGRGLRWISVTMSVAGGVMLAVVFFDLIPESMSLVDDPVIALLGLVWGVVIMSIINYLVNNIDKKIKINTYTQNVNNIKILQNKITNNDRKELKKAGLFLVLAIALHNIPEGIAIGASSGVNVSMGFAMAMVICIHNIPEGMAITLPLGVSNFGKLKAVLLSVVAGSTTVIGGVLGAVLGGMSNVLTALFLAFAGGAMLQVTICEMFRDSILIDNSNRVYYGVIVGVVLGFIFISFL